MDIDVDKLIREVRSRPDLWDKSNNSYHNKAITDKHWQDIQNEMKIPEKRLKNKWKCLREQFRIECKRRSIIKLDNDKMESFSAWPYFKSLLFLKPQTRIRIKHAASSSCVNSGKESTKDNTTQEVLKETTTSNGIQYSNNSTGILPADNFTANNFELTDCHEFKNFDISTESSSTPKEKKNLKRTNGDKMFEIEKKKLKLLEKRAESRVDRDEDEAFFDYLLPHIRRLGPAQKLLCRIELQEVIYKHVYKTPAE